MMNILVLVVVVWVIPILVARSIGNAKNREGLLWGLLLGWIGVVIVALLPAVVRARCPACQEPIQEQATICPHCRSAISWNMPRAAPTPDEEWPEDLRVGRRRR